MKRFSVLKPRKSCELPLFRAYRLFSGSINVLTEFRDEASEGPDGRREHTFFEVFRRCGIPQCQT